MPYSCAPPRGDWVKIGAEARNDDPPAPGGTELSVCKTGRGVLMLVPEIALTPAMVATFYGVFGRRVAIQHSGLSDGERHDQWHRIRRGEVHIVVGTRSAVFAPLE